MNDQTHAVASKKANCKGLRMKRYLSMLALFFSFSVWAEAPCAVSSPQGRVALVELFTSEGCSSCPPADQMLSQWVSIIPTHQAIFLSQHVPYWDYLGWRDPFALPHAEPRQRTLAKENHTSVYTPQFFMNGIAVRPQSLDTLREGIRQTNIQPSPVTLSLQKRGQKISLSWKNQRGVEGQIIGIITSAETQSQVTAGENHNERLRHAEVVRWWQDLSKIKSPQGEVTINIPPIADDGRGHIVLMMTQGHKVIQAVALSRQCQ